MAGIISPEIQKVLDETVKPALRNAKRRWYLLVAGLVLGGIVAYFYAKSIDPVYTSSFTFVLSTDQGGSTSAASSLAAQFGIDAGSSGGSSIFSGDNIIELFKSRKLISTALLSKPDTTKDQSLLNLIAERMYKKEMHGFTGFSQNPATYTPAQTQLYRKIITMVSNSFFVYKRDKKLLFYMISSLNSDPDVSYYVAKAMLTQASKQFIETKTKQAVTSVKLLKHEADSLLQVLGILYNASASVNDRTYNLNPAISTQRTGIQYNMSKATAFSQAYSEVMKSLESAKINLQKETPLYKVIDEPELPLIPAIPSTKKYVAIGALLGLLLTLAISVGEHFYKTKFIDR